MSVFVGLLVLGNRTVGLGWLATRLEGLLGTLETSLIQVGLYSHHWASWFALFVEIGTEGGRNDMDGFRGTAENGLGGGLIVGFSDTLDG